MEMPGETKHLHVELKSTTARDKGYRVVIPVPVPDREGLLKCHMDCTFRTSDEMGAGCVLKTSVDGPRRFSIAPGPRCPGSGEYILLKIDKSDGLVKKFTTLDEGVVISQADIHDLEGRLGVKLADAPVVSKKEYKCLNCGSKLLPTGGN